MKSEPPFLPWHFAILTVIIFTTFGVWMEGGWLAIVATFLGVMWFGVLIDVGRREDKYRRDHSDETPTPL